MPAKMGGFRSPKGIRKPAMNPLGQKPGMSPMGGMPPTGIPGFKKGGKVKKAKK